MFLCWFKHMLLCSQFSVSNLYDLQHLCCVNRKGRQDLIYSSGRNFSCNLCMLGTPVLFLLKGWCSLGGCWLRSRQGHSRTVCNRNNSLNPGLHGFKFWVNYCGEKQKIICSPLSATPFRVTQKWWQESQIVSSSRGRMKVFSKPHQKHYMYTIPSSENFIFNFHLHSIFLPRISK